MHEIQCFDTHYGFQYGSANVTRIYANEKTGAVSIMIKSPKSEAQIYVTRTGKIRIWLDREELNDKKRKGSRGATQKINGKRT